MFFFSNELVEKLGEDEVTLNLAGTPPDMPLPEEMIKLPKISISAINGTAIGGGVNLGLLWQDLAA